MVLPVSDGSERRRALTKGERTRERLLRAAIDRFGAEGFRATSVSQLSRDAGLTPAAAYAYFDDKEAFWREAVQADLDALQREIAAEVAKSERPIIDSMFALINGTQRHPLARRVMVEGTPEDLQLVLAHPIFTGRTKIIELVLQERQAAGTLPPDASAPEISLGLETVLFSLLLTVVRAGMPGSGDRVSAVIALLSAAAGGPPTLQERLTAVLRPHGNG